MSTCPRHDVPLELTAAPVAGGWALACPVEGCQVVRMPERSSTDICPANTRAAAANKLPGLGRLPKTDGTELELVSEQAEGGSKHEVKLLRQIRKRGLPDPIPEFQFNSTRGWKADFAYPALRILIECEGGLWMKGGGRHNRAQGYEKDLEKYNAASIAGWTVLRYSGDMIDSGEAIAEIALVIQWKMRASA